MFGRLDPWTERLVMNFKSPRWFSSYRGSSRDCMLAAMVRPVVDQIWESVNGFKLEDYVYEHKTHDARTQLALPISARHITHN